MKKSLNITLEEKTIQELKEAAKDLEISASAFVTMLFKQYQKEQLAIKTLKDKELLKAFKELIRKEIDKIETTKENI